MPCPESNSTELTLSYIECTPPPPAYPLVVPSKESYLSTSDRLNFRTVRIGIYLYCICSTVYYCQAHLAIISEFQLNITAKQIWLSSLIFKLINTTTHIWPSSLIFKLINTTTHIWPSSLIFLPIINLKLRTSGHHL